MNAEKRKTVNQERARREKKKTQGKAKQNSVLKIQAQNERKAFSHFLPLGSSTFDIWGVLILLSKIVGHRPVLFELQQRF